MSSDASMRENEAAKRLQSIQTERFFREGEAGASRCLRTSIAETRSFIAASRVHEFACELRVNDSGVTITGRIESRTRR